MDTKDKISNPGKRTRTSASGPGRTAAAERTRQGKTARTAVKARTGRRSSRQAERPQNQPSPEVVYTQPGPFNRNRFLLRLATVVAVVLALTFGMSIFFKVETVIVSGMEKYTAWDVREASGIQDGENLLTLNEERAGSKIKAALPYVDTVRIGIKLPGTVNIEIVEMEVVYAIEADDGTWWLISADGNIVDKTNGASAGEYTKVLGVQLTGPAVGQKAVAAEPVPAETAEDGTTVPITVRGSERLDVAISLLQYLESNGIIGDAASVDVSDMDQLEFWYGQRYQVKLGDPTQLSYKIKSVKKAIDQMGDYQTGVLDASFTTWPDEIGWSKLP